MNNEFVCAMLIDIECIGKNDTNLMKIFKFFI